MKKYIILLCATLGLSACMNDFDTETVSTSVFTADGIGTPNTTIAQIRTRYAKAIQSGATTGMAAVKEDLIVEGIVTGNDLSGNIYQAIYIQDIKEDGTIDNEHGGMQVAIKGIGSLAAVFPVGQKVRINLNGLYMSGYGKMPRLGQPYVNTNGALRHGPMPPGLVKTNIQLIDTPAAALAVPHELTSADLKSSNGIDDLTPMFVAIHGCTVAEADGEERYAFVTYGTDKNDSYTVTHTIVMPDGYRAKDLLYTSTSATFAQEVIPQGKVTIYGILGRYNNDYQLILRSIDDVVPEAE